MSTALSTLGAPILAVGPDDSEQRPQAPRGSAPGGNPFQGIGAAYIMVGALLVGGVIGYTIDRWFDSAPVALIVSSLIFIAVGFYHAIRSTK